MTTRSTDDGNPAHRRATPIDATWETPEQVQEDLLRQRHLFMLLTENALLVADTLRDNYLKNTSGFVADLRRAMRRTDPILHVSRVDDMQWADVSGEVVTFIDGGFGQVRIAGHMPLLLRVGSYQVRVGERQTDAREAFGYYPIVMGDIEGGSREHPEFVELVRITAELLGALSALERTPDLDVLMLHGPLMPTVGPLLRQMPFTERDIDLLLRQYGSSVSAAAALKERFLREARVHLYPRLTQQHRILTRERLFEPVTWLSFLYRQLLEAIQRRPKPPLVMGVIERGASTVFSREILLQRVFHNLSDNQRRDYFNHLFGRHDLNSVDDLLHRLGYTDELLLGMLLATGERTEGWTLPRNVALSIGELRLPDLPDVLRCDWSPFRSGQPFGFPHVSACYVRVSDLTEPIRVEVLTGTGSGALDEAARRAWLYARLLPGYGFPVGLDIADKYARVPTWLTDAYGKLIRHHLGVSLQQGQVTDTELRSLLLQALYMNRRDWLFRPAFT